MKKILFLGICLAQIAVLSAQKTIIQDPNAQQRTVTGFHGISVSNSIDLYISQGDEAVAVSASDSKDINRIITRVENGILVIKFDNTGKIGWNMGNKNFKAYVSFKNLDKLSASGSSDIYVKGSITGGDLDLHLSGSSDFKGDVKLDKLDIEQSGSSDVDISGSAATAAITASGASDVKGYGLVTDNCSVQASGSSDIRITVNKELNAHASGASDIYYKGTAVIRDLHSSGSSSVSRKE